MSYILDALKKSEQERSRGTVPDIKTVHQPEVIATNRASQRPYIVLITLLLIAAALGYFIFMKNLSPNAVNLEVRRGDNTAAQSSDSDIGPEFDGQSAGENLSEKTTSQPSGNQIQLAQNLTALREKAETERVASRPSSTSSADLETKSADAVRHSKKNDPGAKTNSKSSKPNVIFSNEPLTEMGDETYKRPTLASVQGASTAADDVVYEIADLPEDVKRDLPTISFAGHVYSSSKSQRSVMLNGKKMREGEELAKGLVLDQITVEGVVFRTQGYRFKLGALQDWSF